MSRDQTDKPNITRHCMAVIVSLFCWILCPWYFAPIAFAANERIDSFVAHIELQQNGSAFVQEEIVYDFGNTPRHGIFRRIPLVYKLPGDEQERVIEVSSIMVTDGLGNLRQTAYDDGGNILELKIGDPEVTVTGKQLYVIRYTVWGAVYELLDQVEFYWNATGNEWPNPIDRARVEVVLPVPINTNRVMSACYAGRLGSTESCKSASRSPTEGDGTTITMLRYEHDGLLPHEGMSVAIGLPKGTMKATAMQKGVQNNPVYSWKNNILNRALLLPLFVLFVMSFVWWKYGRDPGGRGTVVPNYDVPENLSPMEAGVLWDDDLKPQSITAGIIALAIRGYLKIKRVENNGIIFDSADFMLTKLKEPDAFTTPAERLVLNALFKDNNVNILLSSLAHKFVPIKKELQELLFDEMFQRGYFAERPDRVRRNYVIAGSAIIFLSFFLPTYFLAFLISGVIVYIFGWNMPRKTAQGAIVTENLAGLKYYLSVAEKDRIAFHNAPEKNPETFERMLPYAMIFGVEEEWAAQFADLYTDQNAERWYSGVHGMNSVTLTKSLSGFGAATAAAFSAKGGASSGKGGFSGGGAGGGGGGSW